MELYKKIVIGVLGLAVIASGVMLILQSKKNNNVSDTNKSYEFAGFITGGEGNVVKVQGFYMDPKDSKKTLSKPMLVEIQVAASTKLVKTVTYLPATGKSFDHSKLKKEVTEGAMADLLNPDIQGLALRAKSESDIYNKPTFLANEISYSMDVTDIK